MLDVSKAEVRQRQLTHGYLKIRDYNGTFPEGTRSTTILGTLAACFTAWRETNRVMNDLTRSRAMQAR